MHVNDAPRPRLSLLASLFVVGVVAAQPACGAGPAQPDEQRDSHTQALSDRWVDPVAGSDWTLAFGARGKSPKITVCNDLAAPDGPGATLSDHTGHDYGNVSGTSVFAIGAGKVRLDAQGKGVIIIEHDLTPDEQSALKLAQPKVYSAYWHVIRSVQPNDVVVAGQEIGTVKYEEGNSHLHFEMRAGYPVDLSEIAGCPDDEAGIGYIPDHDEVRSPTDYGYMNPTATLATLQKVDASKDPPPTPDDPPEPQGPLSCAEKHDHCYLAGGVAREEEQASCADVGAQAKGQDGRSWQCVLGQDGALRWSQCFVKDGRATDQLASQLDHEGAAPRVGTDGATCWACDRDASRENAVEYWDARDPSACSLDQAPVCSGDGTIVAGESWELWAGCGDVAHLAEGGITECYTNENGAPAPPHHYECVRHDFGAPTGERLVWKKHCGC